MTRLLRLLLVLLLSGITTGALAQGQSGEMIGKVVDNTGEPVINAVVQVIQGGIVKNGTVTDFDGNYIIKPLSPGRYDLKVSYINFKEDITSGVIISPDKKTEVNVKLQPKDNTLEEVVIKEYKVPLIDKYSVVATKTSEEIEAMPTRNTTTVASTAPGVYSQGDGGGLSIGGARGDGTLYIVDGVQVYGSRGINLSQGAIDQIQVMSSGISAKYGDAIGGVVTITTKGVSDRLRGGVLLERSVDGYGHNLFNFNLSGPLLSQKVDSLTRKPVLGFFLSGDVWYDQDRSPEYQGVYLLKDEVLADIRQNPLFAVPNQTGTPVFRYKSEQVTAKDLYMTKRRPNAAVFEGRLNGRLDFQLAEDLNLNIGGSFNYGKSNAYSTAWSLFSPNDIAVSRSYTGRGFVRLQQSFKKKTAPLVGEDGQEIPEVKPLISNAFYTLQVDYQREYVNSEHEQHGRNLFNYGYVGKFNTEYTEIYAPGRDSLTGQFGTRLLLDRFPVATTFQRSDLNPVLANYTTQYYNLIGDNLPQRIDDIRFANAMTNGQMPQSIYGLYTSVGQSNTGFNYAGVTQYGVSVDASFDLQPGKTRHSIEFGLYYQQRTETGYSIGAANTNGGLWQYMRLLTNRHITLDRDNPIFIIDGKQYTADQLDGLSGISFSPYDTIYYNRKSIDADQSTFDKNLRSKLGLSATDYINIDGLDPSTFSVDMFSADELLNSGNPYVGYRGYDYKGNKVKGQVNFNDFFTKKDENGNYTRDIGAFRPNYMAGYILDKFQFKDIFFNIGLRVERFDANTKVLKDPYSLYEVNTVADAQSIGKVKNNFTEGGVTPSNIGSDYVVYVNNNESSSPAVIGYRNGDDWYDPYGRVVLDPTSLKQYSGGRDPQPYLVNNDVRITDSNFNPNSSFTDYKPQINVMPRIAFNFPISDVALFYAHYDVLVQRPKSGVITTPADYYFMTANPGGFVNNPDLKPEKMFDYEVGFKQSLSQNAAITISGFYKERKDMIQARPYLYAWPTTYYTFGNRDFSTTKGLILHYDMRRKRNLRMDISYTLQYANGTGSSATSSIAGSPSAPGLLSGFISAGLPNIRTTFPLNIDTRHLIVATLDYRFANGKGPVVADKHILQNAGANLIIRTRSGEPYTKYTQPTPIANTISGQVNGSRLAWHYMLDLKVDKNFMLKFGKDNMDGDITKPRRRYAVNAFVLITNLLNTKDILGVNGYTGRADDNGYLASPQGIQNINNQLVPQSYLDLYTVRQISGAGYNLPRRINIGLGFNF
ncbi:MAG: carboxypeptidase-like regulatory domain-containing protein [Chitinophagales bacterium]|nr:carboxypeptidase-like regulatory domain-containing protein [Chitinophagaceae bacterium]MCB9065536.1 carboxypeptidase-like regulatory domain-containing protein [Chitinophagales bacterium]